MGVKFLTLQQHAQLADTLFQRKQTKKIKIKIDRCSNVPGAKVVVGVMGTDKQFSVQEGSLIEFESDKPVQVGFFVGFGKTCFANVEPGKKYLATWYNTAFSTRIERCTEVDVIDS